MLTVIKIKKLEIPNIIYMDGAEELLISKLIPAAQAVVKSHPGETNKVEFSQNLEYRYMSDSNVITITFGGFLIKDRAVLEKFAGDVVTVVQKLDIPYLQVQAINSFELPPLHETESSLAKSKPGISFDDIKESKASKKSSGNTSSELSPELKAEIEKFKAPDTVRSRLGALLKELGSQSSQPSKVMRLNFILKHGTHFEIMKREIITPQNAIFFSKENKIIVFYDRIIAKEISDQEWLNILAHEVTHAYKFLSHRIRNGARSNEEQKNDESYGDPHTVAFYPLKREVCGEFSRAIIDGFSRITDFYDLLVDCKKGAEIPTARKQKLTQYMSSLKDYQPRKRTLSYSPHYIPELANSGSRNQVNSGAIKWLVMSKMPRLTHREYICPVYIHQIKLAATNGNTEIQYELEGLHCADAQNPLEKASAFFWDMYYLNYDLGTEYNKDKNRMLTELHASLAGELPEATLNCFFEQLVAYDTADTNETQKILSSQEPKKDDTLIMVAVNFSLLDGLRQLPSVVPSQPATQQQSSAAAQSAGATDTAMPASTPNAAPLYTR